MNEKEMPLSATNAGDEEACAWVVRLSSDQRTHQDEARFKEWLGQDQGNAARFEEGLAVWDELGALRGSPEAHAALGHLYDASIIDHSDRRHWYGRRAILGGGVAAAAAVFAGVLAVPKMLARGVAYQTAKGEQRRFALPDGTTVVLDTATRIETAFGDDHRSITLVRGQAFFDVARDPSRPFRVFAGDDEIRALGTAFQVRYEGGAAKVTLEEGKIAVFRDVAVNNAPVHLGADKLESHKAAFVLAPGQAAELTVAKPARVTSVDLSKTDAWRSGEMVFDDVPLSAAVAEVNRYGGPRVVLGDPTVANMHISGTFHTNRPEAFVEGVTAALPVRLQESDATKLVLGKL